MSPSVEPRPFSARYACSEGCRFTAPLTHVIYRCPDCGGLLHVQHDVDALRQLDADAWKERFAATWGAVRLPQASGVWGKQEWVLPGLPREHVVSLGEGRGPLTALPRYARELGLGSLELKHCGISPTGSFKDLGMTVLVSAVRHLRAQGVPVRAVACASTGDTSAALAAYCAAAGLPSVVFLPRDKVTLSQLVQPLSSGAHVLSLDTDFDGCMRVVQEVTREASLYLANSMNSLRLEGQKTVAIEVCQQRDWEPPDWFVIPGGNLGNVSALGAGLELMLSLGLIRRRPRILVAQARAANPLVRALASGGRGGQRELTPMQAGPTLASAIRIGNPVSFRRALAVLSAFEGTAEDATEPELANAAARADREGAFADPHTGVALAALEKAVAAGVVPRGARVVVVSTAHGLKFPDFKAGYHRGGLEGVQAALPNPPVELPADVGAVVDALTRRLGA